MDWKGKQEVDPIGPSGPSQETWGRFTEQKHDFIFVAMRKYIRRETREMVWRLAEETVCMCVCVSQTHVRYH